jgi:hypothetical protein
MDSLLSLCGVCFDVLLLCAACSFWNVFNMFAQVKIAAEYANVNRRSAV